MIKNKKWFSVLILWALLIIYLSHQPAAISSQQSKFVLLLIEKLNIDLSQSVIRSFAHVFVYFVLGFLFKKSFDTNYKIFLIFGILFIISDETHQYFIPGRSFQIEDIIFDLIGYNFSLLIFKLKN